MTECGLVLGLCPVFYCQLLANMWSGEPEREGEGETEGYVREKSIVYG